MLPTIYTSLFVVSVRGRGLVVIGTIHCSLEAVSGRPVQQTKRQNVTLRWNRTLF